MAKKGKPAEEAAGAPAWVMTFADLMSLLMCFFVLLLSFSEMDAAKYKEVAGSMKFAFGVQRDIKVTEKPKGVSIIAKEYTPGKPQPTLEKVLRQQTTDENREYIEVLVPSDKGIDGQNGRPGDEDGQGGREGKDGADEGRAGDAGEDRGGRAGDGEGGGEGEQDLDKAAQMRAAEEQARRLRIALAEQIEEGLMEIQTLDDGVLVKVREQGSFPSGAADLNHAFVPVLDTIAMNITDRRSRLVVSGHSDDIPISTGRYPSNWMLSAARATSVVQTLVDRGMVEHERMEVRAHADTVPVDSNRTAQGRARNRRVEIFIGTPPAGDATTGPDVYMNDALQEEHT